MLVVVVVLVAAVEWARTRATNAPASATEEKRLWSRTAARSAGVSAEVASDVCRSTVGSQPARPPGTPLYLSLIHI